MQLSADDISASHRTNFRVADKPLLIRVPE